MSDAAAATAPVQQKAPSSSSSSLPSVKIPHQRTVIDFATILGLFFSVALIVGAIMMGHSDANFFNVPSLLIVVLGTMAATTISYTGDELGKSISIMMGSLSRKVTDPKKLAITLMDIAVIARKKGILALSELDKDLVREPFLRRAARIVVDGYTPEDVESMLFQEIEVEIERNKRSAGIARRASEVAPAMGLIGTLVGLVQMLAELENPEAIGPAMAVALLTTFYGAILGTVVMAPLGVKLEKNAQDDALIKTLIASTAASIARQENPRRLEMVLNTELPASARIRYFD